MRVIGQGGNDRQPRLRESRNGQGEAEQGGQAERAAKVILGQNVISMIEVAPARGSQYINRYYRAAIMPPRNRPAGLSVTALECAGWW